MILETLLGELTPQQFVKDSFHRLPVAMPGTAQSLCRLGSADVLDQVFRSDPPPDLMVVRQGQRSGADPPRSFEEVLGLAAAGHTTLVRQAERHHPELRQLAEEFTRQFDAPVNIHVYVTPPDTHGFSWHYDAEDVFIIQATGVKVYSLRKNTVNPWPLEETIPRNMRYERELMPLMQAELQAGDWLYIPCGYWHMAQVPKSDEVAVSLAVGVMSPSAIAVFDALRSRLLDSIFWRQRLPVIGEAAALGREEMEARYAELFEQLGEEIGSALRSPEFLRSYLEGTGPADDLRDGRSA